MDFGSWADWARALLGAIVTYTAMTLLWKVVSKAAEFNDPLTRSGRHIALVPRFVVRPRRTVIRTRLRAANALRRHQGLPVTTQSPSRLVDMDRARRQLALGRLLWSRVIPAGLLVSGMTLGLWVLLQDMHTGPFAGLPVLSETLEAVLGAQGWYEEGSDGCASWSYLRGCESSMVPWWSGIESGPAVGTAAQLLLSAWLLRRTADVAFSAWSKQVPPDIECLNALSACRDLLRPSAPDPAILDMSVAELRAGVEGFTRGGLVVGADRRTELEEHGSDVARVLHEAMGQVLRDGVTALPALIVLLATVQDRLHDSRWLVLLDQSTLAGTPAPSPAITPAPSTAAPAGDPGRWQKYVAVATALPAVPAMLALILATVTINQTKDSLKLTERNQVVSDYNDTVTNLGDDSLNVRTSAIYAIQRIMRDAPRDQPALVQILGSYIREHAKMPDPKLAERKKKDERTRPPDDVQAALNVLGARQGGEEVTSMVDLRDTFLVGATLTGNFYADLRGADLTRANLGSGSFEDSWFDDAEMPEAVLSDGVFDNADFINTNLRNAWWDGASLMYADLTNADLTGISYIEVRDDTYLDLEGAEMSGANLTDADLSGAYLINADLSADAQNEIPAAILSATNLTGTDLSETELDGTKMDKAILDEAILP